jgi:hypothetical protein
MTEDEPLLTRFPHSFVDAPSVGRASVNACSIPDEGGRSGRSCAHIYEVLACPYSSSSPRSSISPPSRWMTANWMMRRASWRKGREGGRPRSAAAAVDVLEGHICQGRARGPVVLQDGPPGTHARGVTPPSRR